MWDFHSIFPPAHCFLFSMFWSKHAVLACLYICSSILMVSTPVFSISHSPDPCCSTSKLQSLSAYNYKSCFKCAQEWSFLNHHYCTLLTYYSYTHQLFLPNSSLYSVTAPFLLAPTITHAFRHTLFLSLPLSPILPSPHFFLPYCLPPLLLGYCHGTGLCLYMYVCVMELDYVCMCMCVSCRSSG